MAKKEKRFEATYSQDMGSVKIYVDKQTGVNYMYIGNGYGGGVTPLLNRDGTPMITTVLKTEEK